MTDASVSVGYARALLDLAVEKGAPRAQLVQRAGLIAVDMDQPESRLPFTMFKTLMRQAKILSGDAALGLHFGTEIPFNDLSLVGLICHAAPTMPEAFTQMNRYGRLVIEVEGTGAGDRFVIDRSGNAVWIVDTRQNPNAFPELTESTLGRFICGFGRVFPDLRLYLAAEVTHEAPPYAAEYETLLNVPVRFGCRRNAMQIDPDLFEIRLQKRPRYVFGILSQQADALLKSLEESKTIAARVESLIMPILHTGGVNVESIAAQMGVSRQTLYRQLKDEGHTFDAVLDDLRRRLALHYLNGEKVSVNQTAYLVGFSDPSSFSRAFKRWTGQSPGRFAAAS